MTMALVTRVISDITGKEGDPSELISLVVRQHPAITYARQLDMLPDDLEGLTRATDLVILEFAGSVVYTTHKEFAKLVSDEVVVNAQGTRGRRRGFSPKAR